MAPCGNTELDGLIDQALSAVGQLAGASWLSVYVAGHGGGWSSDLGQALTLLPEGYNFSLGLRDGIYWAWIQPNDRWEPGENESRHDHPLGSGLLVGYTATLALSAAAIMLWARRIKVRAA